MQDNGTGWGWSSDTTWPLERDRGGSQEARASLSQRSITRLGAGTSRGSGQRAEHKGSRFQHHHMWLWGVGDAPVLADPQCPLQNRRESKWRVWCGRSAGRHVWGRVGTITEWRVDASCGEGLGSRRNVRQRGFLACLVLQPCHPHGGRKGTQGDADPLPPAEPATCQCSPLWNDSLHPRSVRL